MGSVRECDLPSLLTRCAEELPRMREFRNSKFEFRNDAISGASARKAGRG